MEVLIRADADAATGMGHAMRCLALAQALIAAGNRVTWLGRWEPTSLQHRLAAAGVNAVPTTDQPGGREDLAHALVRGAHSDWIVLDGYHFGAEFLGALRNTGSRIMVIDDAPRLSFYNADLLLDQNLHPEPPDYCLPAGARPLLGPRYALLRSEFSRRPARSATPPHTAQNILVTMGGSDPNGVTLNVLKACDHLARLHGNPFIRVVIGHSNPRKAEVLSMAGSLGLHAEVLVAVEDMGSLMNWAHLAVTAGGSTCWELAAVGVPMVILTTAPNQTPVAEGLHRAGAGLHMGDASAVHAEDLTCVLATLIRDAERRGEMGCRGRRLVDGLGASRVADALSQRDIGRSPHPLSLRQAAEQDAETLWHWANDPSVRAASFHKDPIPWEAHTRWFARRIHAADVRFWILEENGRPVGQIRYERSDALCEAILNFSISADERGKGYGEYLVNITKARALKELGVSQVTALVLAGNAASAKVFRRAGFWFEGLDTVDGQECLRFTWREGDDAS
ncbi:MAG: UDP-2,4-diacetamido-2,4,6-trideoxy-beta-L-altropyranose hydrolase [Chthonomonadales bacterium]